jgi:hypothetical protein
MLNSLEAAVVAEAEALADELDVREAREAREDREGRGAVDAAVAPAGNAAAPT